MRMAAWWHRARWLLRPVFVPVVFINAGFNRLFGFVDHPPWFWMLWCFLWPIMAAHIGHWAGPYMLPYAPGIATWIHDWIWDPLMPVTHHQMADIGWWLGLFLGLIDLAFQSGTYEFEEVFHPGNRIFEQPGGDLVFPITFLAVKMMDWYVDVGFIPFLVFSAALIGMPVALMRLAIWWANTHQWSYALGHGVLVAVAIFVGFPVGIGLGMALSVGAAILWWDIIKLWAPGYVRKHPPGPKPIPRPPSKAAKPPILPEPPRPPDDRIRL